ncbi:hypothetical protein RCO48_22445 [Peribacillus frigoritolerans]|nr:hypothetical protein [Peribacillus frigoritolerans]
MKILSVSTILTLTDSAYPSEGDITLNNYPEVGHLIILFANSTPELKSFQLTGKKSLSDTIKIRKLNFSE